MTNELTSPHTPDRGFDPNTRVLVFGATGYIGSHLVPRLVRDGLAVRASGRNRKVLEAREWAGVELVEADALRPDSLPIVLEGVDTAFYLVHSMAAGHAFGILDLQAAENFAAAAAQAGVRRIVYLGGLIPVGADSEHLVSRRETGEKLRAGRVPVTEIRAGIIVGPGSAAYEVIRDLVNHLPVMFAPRWVKSKSAPIALDNLLDYLVRVAWLDEAAGKVLDAAGSDYLSYEEVMRQYGECVGKQPRIIRVPMLTPSMSAYWLGLVTAVPANIARALIGGLKHDLPADDAELRRLVPLKLLSFREAVAAALLTEQTHTVSARWSEGLLMFRDFSIDNAFYAKRASGNAISSATPQAVWHTIATLGGDNGYYCMGWLWWVRGLIDWLVGGPGLTRGRRHPTELRIGDRVDYWTVLAMQPAQRLTLHFGMRAPGSGVLEFEIDPEPADTTGPDSRPQTRLTITAYWHPQGVWGLLYWYALVPAHLFIFRAMSQAMLRRAAQIDAKRSAGL
jgi:uncharacterized protein YbjT (DUF2867 family)